MLPETIVPEKEDSTSDFEKARNFLEKDFRTSYLHTTLDKLDIRPDGHVDVEGKRIPYTQGFLEAVAGAIKMPFSFAYDIDFELFRYNFESLKTKRRKGVTLCINRGAAINIADTEYRPAHTLDVLEGLQNQNFWKFQQILISDRGAEINHLNPQLKTNPEPGDVIKLGIRISNSETGYRGLKASLFSFRLVCTNGAVMSDRLGTARWNYDRRVTYASSLQKFLKDLEKLQLLEKRLVTLYEGAMDRRVFDRDFVRMWRRLRNALDPSDVDRSLEVERKQRLEIQATVRQRPDREAPEPTPWTVYELHNRITASAQRHAFSTRRRLEQIGGDLLYRTSLN